MTAPQGPTGGLAVFRVRRRGRAREAGLCELLVPQGDVRIARALTRAVIGAAKADYVVRLGSARGFLPLPRRGPVLAWRAQPPPGAAPRVDDWELTLGDIELF